MASAMSRSDSLLWRRSSLQTDSPPQTGATNNIRITSDIPAQMRNNGDHQPSETSITRRSARSTGWQALPGSLKARYKGQGVSRELINKKLPALNEGDLKKNLDEMLSGSICAYQQSPHRLQHHLIHRAFLGVLFLGFSGAAQWVGTSGLMAFFSRQGLSAAASTGMAYSTTLFSFLTSNLFGAYAANRLRFEGVFHVHQLMTAFIAFLPVCFEAYATYSALLLLGAPGAIAVACALVNGLSNQLFLWEMLEMFVAFLQGKDTDKEDLADRAAWLQGELIKELAQDPDLLAIVDNSPHPNWSRIGTTLAERIISKTGRYQKLMTILPLSSRTHKVKNIIRALRERRDQQEAGIPAADTVTVKALDDEAVQTRLTGPRLWLRRGTYIALHTMNMGYVWGITSHISASILRGTNLKLTCDSASFITQYAYYAIIGQITALGSAISDTMLQLTNFSELSMWLKSNKWKELCHKKTIPNIALFTLGFTASLSFALSGYGIVWTSLQTDLCLGGLAAVEYTLPPLVALSGLLLSWNLGTEFKGIYYSVKDLTMSCYNTLIKRDFVAQVEAEGTDNEV